MNLKKLDMKLEGRTEDEIKQVETEWQEFKPSAKYPKPKVYSPPPRSSRKSYSRSSSSGSSSRSRSSSRSSRSSRTSLSDSSRSRSRSRSRSLTRKSKKDKGRVASPFEKKRRTTEVRQRNQAESVWVRFLNLFYSYLYYYCFTRIDAISASFSILVTTEAKH